MRYEQNFLIVVIFVSHNLSCEISYKKKNNQIKTIPVWKLYTLKIFLNNLNGIFSSVTKLIAFPNSAASTWSKTVALVISRVMDG